MKHVILPVLFSLVLVLPTAAQELAGEGQTPGSRVVVTGLSRDAGETITLRFQLINDGDGKIKTYGVLGEFFGMSYVNLIDSANKKKYLVVKDTEGKCICSELQDDVVKGSSFNLWAKFPAPPADVQTITVVIPGFAPVESVLIGAAP